MFNNIKITSWILVLLSGLYSADCFSQSCDGKKTGSNKVTNGDFEQVKTTCVNDIGPLYDDAHGAISWDGIGITSAQAIYMNTCSGLGTYNPSDNLYGSQLSHSSDGHYALFCGPAPLDIPGDNFYGYLKQQLNKPLLKGVTYYIEFYVSLADISTIGTKSLGMYLTNNVNDFIINSDPFSSDYHSLNSLTPQIPNVFPAATAYLDYQNWTKICGNYTPSVDGVQYIAIGSFRNGPYADSGSPGYKGKKSGRPKYYVDDVYISEYSCCPEEKLYQNTSSLPSKTSVNKGIYAGNSVLPPPNGNVVVPNGQNVLFKAGTEVILKPGFIANSGSSFTAKIAACDAGSDDNQLIVGINFISTGANSYTLTAAASHGSGNYTYRWSTGATTPTISCTYGANTYTVVVTDNVLDNTYSAPCNIRVGWAEYRDSCPTCRSAQTVARQETTLNSTETISISAEQSMSIYPNPSDGVFTLENGGNIIRYSIYNTQGQLIQDLPLEKNTERNLTIDLRGRPKGAYILKLIDAENKVRTAVLMVK